FFGILAAVCTFGSWYFGQRADDEKELVAANHGRLVPSTDDGISKLFIQDGNGIGIPIQTGRNSGTISFSDPSGNAFSILNENMLNIIRENGAVRVSAKFRNSDGE